MEKNKTPFFKKLLIASTKPKDYHLLIHEGVGRAFFYLFLFTLTFGLLASIIAAVKTELEIRNIIKVTEQGMPNFTFENGKLDVDIEEPIVTENEGYIFILDDTGTYDQSDLEEYNEGALLLADRIIFKDGYETTEIHFKDFKDISFDQDTIKSLMPYLHWISIIVGVFLLFWFFISKMAAALFYGVISLIIAAIQKQSFTFGKLYSASIYAITLPTILTIVGNAISYSIPWFLTFAVTIIFLWIGLKNMPPAEKVAEEPDYTQY
ncbi:DUF1189 domain-containing protein [Bacillus timonensis]|nr:DUF1189 domain-containing protein [Bacillus timonensis]